MLYKIYTDGSALGRTPNYIGGWGAVVVKDDVEVSSLTGSKFPATNNEMELTALLESLKYAIELYKNGEATEIEIYTDSAYSLNSITDWMYKWAVNGWVNSKKQPVANIEIMKEFYSLLSFPIPYIKFKKVKGHIGDTFNERADDLATDSSAKLKLELAKGEE